VQCFAQRVHDGQLPACRSRFDYPGRSNPLRLAQRKLIFGSDGPWLHPGLERERIASAPARRSDSLLAGAHLQMTSPVRALPKQFSSTYARPLN